MKSNFGIKYIFDKDELQEGVFQDKSFKSGLITKANAKTKLNEKIFGTF